MDVERVDFVDTAPDGNSLILHRRYAPDES
jgi:hypothetical protein